MVALNIHLAKNLLNLLAFVRIIYESLTSKKFMIKLNILSFCFVDDFLILSPETIE